jgi:hypothetical protein
MGCTDLDDEAVVCHLKLFAVSLRLDSAGFMRFLKNFWLGKRMNIASPCRLAKK